MAKYFVIFLLFIAGCGFSSDIADPNSGLNQAIDAIGVVAEGGKAATGTPWGLPIGGLALAVSVGVGAYKNYRKRQKITEQRVDLDNVTLAAKCITEAIEELAANPEIKVKVAEKLRDHDFYNVGKAVISGIKNGQT